jgi:uncharacterized protein YggL (DUF469 family)
MTIDALDMPLLDEIQLLIRAVPFTLKQNRKTQNSDNSLQDESIQRVGAKNKAALESSRMAKKSKT